jgi:hypothetical protein
MGITDGTADHPAAALAAPSPRMGGRDRLGVLYGESRDVAGAVRGYQGAVTSSVDFGFRARRKHPGLAVDVACEPCGHPSLLLQQIEIGRIPDELREIGLIDDELTAQFEGQFFEARPDVILLSIGPAATQSLWRRSNGTYIVRLPERWEQRWSAAQRAWIHEHLEPMGPVTGEQFRRDLARLVREVKAHGGAHVVVLNASTFNPREEVWRLNRDADSLSLRIHAMNLAVMKVSRAEGISIVDVDRLIAELGARNVVSGAVDYTAAAFDVIGDELIRIMEDIGFFEKRPLAPQLGSEGRDDDL